MDNNAFEHDSGHVRKEREVQILKYSIQTNESDAAFILVKNI